MADQVEPTVPSHPTSVPPAPKPNMIYTLPSRLQYIASSDAIENPSVPMRVGQICSFLFAASPDGEKCWIGITTSQIFSSRWGGMASPPIFDEASEQLLGRVAYEVEVQQPVKADVTTDRGEVRPTGRKVGTVVGAGRGGLCYVKIEKWFSESVAFVSMGAWREFADRPPQEGEMVFMDIAS